MKDSKFSRGQRGNSIILAMIVLSALGTLSSLTVVTVKGGIATTGADRFHSTALYAAESGGAAAMDYLRKNIDSVTGWKNFVSPGNHTPLQPAFTGNNVQPGDASNPFSTDIQGWYSVQILNNRSDSGFAAGLDNDKRVIIRATGYGPNGAVAIVEWEITAQNITGMGRPCPAYGQKDMAEDGAGRNDCLGVVNTADTTTFTPAS